MNAADRNLILASVGAALAGAYVVNKKKLAILGMNADDSRKFMNGLAVIAVGCAAISWGTAKWAASAK